MLLLFSTAWVGTEVMTAFRAGWEMNSAFYFEELQVGQTWTSARRTVTESDIVIFAGMTGDYDRAHVDHDYASKSRFKQPLMHGMMGLAWVAGLSTTAPAVQTLALVSVDQWNFLRPVHIGDTVYAVTEVIELAKGGRSAGKVTWRKSLLNQLDEVVQSGIFVSLVELRPKLGRGRVPAPHQTALAARPAASGTYAATASYMPASPVPASPVTAIPAGARSASSNDTPSDTISIDTESSPPLSQAGPGGPVAIDSSTGQTLGHTRVAPTSPPGASSSGFENASPTEGGSNNPMSTPESDAQSAQVAPGTSLS